MIHSVGTGNDEFSEGEVVFHPGTKALFLCSQGERCSTQLHPCPRLSQTNTKKEGKILVCSVEGKDQFASELLSSSYSEVASYTICAIPPVQYNTQMKRIYYLHETFHKKTLFLTSRIY
jgi:hypothetical protein